MTPAPLAGTDLAHQLASSIESVLSVERVITSARAPARIELYGQLLTDPERAYGEMAARFAELGCTPVLRRSGGGVVVIALPKVAARPSSRDAGALVSFGLTVISVLYAGGLLQATDWLWPFQHPLAGVPFAIGLLGVLVAHELGHYLVSRRLGVATSLPFFIPMPVLSLFGTMGAIIRTREPMRNRRQVLAIGAAGPLSGLIVAVPLLLLGLLRSEVQPILNTPGSLMEGNFALYALHGTGIRILPDIICHRQIRRHGGTVGGHPERIFLQFRSNQIVGKKAGIGVDACAVSACLYGLAKRFDNRRPFLSAQAVCA
ncbi:MAG TPA: site-2 protease family protein, partial [Anaerolineae bacterium]|nr:site-2 protease family protein [Anaerolineae bacterium]